MRTGWRSILLAWALLVNSAVAQDAPSNIDPKIDEILRRMEQSLVDASALAFTAEIALDELHPSGLKIQRSARRAMAIRRPNRLISDVDGDLGNRSAWYDGKTIAVLDKAHHTYALLDVASQASNIDTALDFVADEYDVVLPLADFVRTDVHASLFTNAKFGLYVGLTKVDGITCHQLALANEFIEWQLWINAEGRPLPVKITITYTDEPGEPQYRARFSSWNLSPELPDEAFQFIPPEDATKIAASEMAAGIPTPEEEQP